ncbi:MAG: NAD-dependent epimerase/dehydratase family protein, partial [Pseudomonas sp.]
RFTREDSLESLQDLVAQSAFIFHLAGVNRPTDPEEFKSGNTDLTQALCAAIVADGRQVPILYTSSSQAELDNPYGSSKRGAEDALLALNAQHGVAVHLFRLPNVFGKWAKPNYNSAVATFCYNITHDLSISVNDRQAQVNLVYIDDVVGHFVAVMDGKLS